MMLDIVYLGSWLLVGALIGVMYCLLNAAYHKAEQRRLKQLIHIAQVMGRLLADLAATQSPANATIGEQRLRHEVTEQAFKRAANSLQEGTR